MVLSSSVAPHLPHLRRFSRALTGSQQAGDAYVAAVLEALIAEPQSIKDTDNLRIMLYRMFCHIWSSISLNLKSAPDAGERAGNPPQWAKLAQRRISAIPPLAREAFLLLAVEGFSVSEIAVILDSDGKGVAALIEQAAAAIADQVATNVLIIEDEPVIAIDLKSILEQLGHRITGVARTHRQAAELAAKERPGLILADIQLADGSSGIEAVNQILTMSQVPVIFITAFPERLLTGERPEPAFLITKPFTPEMVKAVVSQALFFDTKASAAA